MSMLDEIVFWHWLAGGLVLVAAEMLLPGYFLFWLGLAAFAVGLVLWAVPFGMELQLALFAVAAVLSIYAGRRWFARGDRQDHAHGLNQPAMRWIGHKVVLSEPLGDAGGRIKLGDGWWRAELVTAGVTLPAGARVEIVGVEGTCVRVRPVSA